MFKKGFKQAGRTPLGTYLKQYHVGDIVDIKADPSIHAGMPHKYYQGRTGRVVNVSPRAVTVIIFKVVGNRYMEKRVNVRIEHVRHSKCRQEFIDRVKSNAEKKKEAKAAGTHVELKRLPAAPREARTISVSKTNALETLTPLPYDTYI